MKGVRRVNGKRCECFNAKSYNVVGSGHNVACIILNDSHIVEPQRYNCDERQVVIKLVVDFHDVGDNATPLTAEELRLWAAKDCMFREG